MISWHLLYDQLKNTPELLEEERALDNVAVSSESDFPQQKVKKNPEKEQQALRKLQAKLGNSGLQKLFNLQTRSEAKKPTGKKMPPAPQSVASAEKGKIHEPGLSQTEPPSTQQDSVPNSNNITQYSANDSSAQLNESDMIESAASKQQNSAEIVRESEVMEPQSSEMTPAKRRQQEHKLLLFISNLPTPSVALWQQVCELYLLLDKASQQQLVESIVKYVRNASKAKQETFFSNVRRLPAKVITGAFASILLQQLLAVFSNLQAEPEVEPPPPEEPD